MPRGGCRGIDRRADCNLTDFVFPGTACGEDFRKMKFCDPAAGHGSNETYASLSNRFAEGHGKPASGSPHNFTRPQTYTVTAADGSTRRLT